MSFYHVNKPEIDCPADMDPTDQAIYDKGKENLDMFIEKGYLVRDDVPRMYIYGQRMGEHRQHGIVCLSSIDDYEKDIIKKHELTTSKKELDRTNLCDTTGANAGPVFLSFRATEEI